MNCCQDWLFTILRYLQIINSSQKRKWATFLILGQYSCRFWYTNHRKEHKQIFTYKVYFGPEHLNNQYLEVFSDCISDKRLTSTVYILRICTSQLNRKVFRVSVAIQLIFFCEYGIKKFYLKYAHTVMLYFISGWCFCFYFYS